MPESAKVLEAIDVDCVRLVDMVQIFGVTKQRCHQLAQRDDFPTPARRIGRRRLWLRSEVELWACEPWARPWNQAGEGEG